MRFSGYFAAFLFFVVSGLNITAIAGDKTETKLPAIKFRVDHGTTWRPKDFWQLKESFNDDVCQKLDHALQEPWGVKYPGRTSTAMDIDIMLGNPYSIKWDNIAHYIEGFPASRVSVDINGDGKKEVIYRLAHMLGGPFIYELLWTNSYPANETKITVQRLKEIKGEQLKEPGWEKYDGHTFYIIKNSVQSTLATPIPYLDLDLVDIVVVNGKAYILESQAFSFNKPLDIYVFKTFSERSHQLICHFVSNYKMAH